jgi:transcriptional regulator with XRE-family HTH domain
MTFQLLLRELRDRIGYTEAELAEVSGVGHGALHTYCLGLSQPSFVNVVKLARALRVSVEVFATCDDFVVQQPTRQRGKGKVKVKGGKHENDGPVRGGRHVPHNGH